MRTSYYPYTKDEIRQVAPSVFAEHAWSGVSERYRFIKTIDVVESLMDEGWDVVKATQNRVRVKSKYEFTRHQLRFRRKGQELIKVGGVYPEIVLTNAHDRAAAFLLHAGLFRLVCSNGLTVDDSTFAKFAIRHTGDAPQLAKEGAEQIVQEVPQIINSVEQMQAMELTEEERRIFAEVAFKLKWDVDNGMDPMSLLDRRRYDDEKNDLWTVMNVIQENLIKGGIQYYRLGNNRRMTTRGVMSITEDNRLNREIFALAQEIKLRRDLIGAAKRTKRAIAS